MPQLGFGTKRLWLRTRRVIDLPSVQLSALWIYRLRSRWSLAVQSRSTTYRPLQSNRAGISCRNPPRKVTPATSRVDAWLGLPGRPGRHRRDRRRHKLLPERRAPGFLARTHPGGPPNWRRSIRNHARQDRPPGECSSAKTGMVPRGRSSARSSQQVRGSPPRGSTRERHG
jgi:hypothetical protein